MLQTIREHTQGWISGTIIGIIIVSFAFWGIHSYFIGGVANTDVATVNGESISKIQYMNMYETLKRQYQEQFGQNNPFAGNDALLRKMALRNVISAEVMKQSAIDQNYHISDAQITQVLQSIPNMPPDMQLSGDQFQRIYDQLLVSQPRAGIVFSSFALPDQVLGTIALLQQQRDFDFMKISSSALKAQLPNIDNAKIEAYYNAHKKDFMTEEQVSIEYIQLNLKDVSATITPSNYELDSYYSQNQDSYKLPMQWKLQSMEIPIANNAKEADVKIAVDKANRAYEALSKGETFAKVAEGNMGTLTDKDWVQISKVPTEYQKAVASLTASGQVTKPFRTSKGFVIIKAVAVQDAKPQSFADVKDKVKDTLVRQQAEAKLADMRDRLADITYEHPESLQTAAKELNLPIKSSEFFTRDKGNNDLTDQKRVRDVAFSTDVLKAQNNSDVIQLDPETLVVIRLKEHKAAKLEPLADVRSDIETILKNQEIANRTEDLAKSLLTKLQNGDDPQQVATANNLAWVTEGLTTRFDTKIDAAINETAFKLPEPGKQNKPSYGIARLSDGFAIIRLISVKPGNVDDKKQYQVFADQIQDSDGRLEYELYSQSAIKDAKIRVN